MELKRENIKGLLEILVKPYPMTLGLAEYPSQLFFFGKDNKDLLSDFDGQKTDDNFNDLLKNSVETINYIENKLANPIIKIEGQKKFEIENEAEKENLRMILNFTANFVVSFLLKNLPQEITLDNKLDFKTNIDNLLKRSDYTLEQVKKDFSRDNFKTIVETIDSLLNSNISENLPEKIVASLIYVDLAIHDILTPITHRKSYAYKRSNELVVSNPVFNYFKDKYLSGENRDNNYINPILKSRVNLLSNLNKMLAVSTFTRNYYGQVKHKGFVDNTIQNTILSPNYLGMIAAFEQEELENPKRKRFYPVIFEPCSIQKEERSEINYDIIKIASNILKKHTGTDYINVSNLDEVSSYNDENDTFVIDLDKVRKSNINAGGLQSLINNFIYRKAKVEYIQNNITFASNSKMLESPNEMVILAKNPIVSEKDKAKFLKMIDSMQEFVNEVISKEPKFSTIFACESTDKEKNFTIVLDTNKKIVPKTLNKEVFYKSNSLFNR